MYQLYMYSLILHILEAKFKEKPCNQRVCWTKELHRDIQFVQNVPYHRDFDVIFLTLIVM